MSDVDMQVIEQERRKLSRRLDEVSRLCEADVPPATFYGEMLKRLLESLAAPAGAVWTRTPQGNLQLQFQVNLREVGLDKSEEARQSHEELLRTAVTNPGLMHLPPRSGVGQAAQEGKAPPGNPTDFLLLLVPIKLNDDIGGLIEVWQNPNRPSTAVDGFLKYMELMAGLATRYQRHQMLGQMTGQQQVWTQLEQFTRTIHGSLNPLEVAYLIANEGRRLIECDRVSVAVRYGRKPRIEAISGADIVERRSNLVQLMRKLCTEVINWGEKLVFTGVKDDSLPPKVLDALDKYLEESASKLLVIQPLKDDREKDSKRPPRSALMMEAFDPPAEPMQLVARLDIVAKHATSALYNSVEHRRIPMRFIWMPLAYLQEGLGGQAQAIAMAIAVGVTLLISLLVFVPYPLKMDSEGKMLPQARQIVYYGGGSGRITHFDVNPGDVVTEDRVLFHVRDIEQANKLADLDSKLKTARTKAEAAKSAANNMTGKEKDEKMMEARNQETQADLFKAQGDAIRNSMAVQAGGADANFLFTVTAPRFTPDQVTLMGDKPHEWTILNSNFKDEMTGKTVRPSDPIMRLGAVEGPWELEMKIPQKHIGQVRKAFDRLDTDVLDVDFLLKSDPTRKFQGKLYRNKIAGEAVVRPDEATATSSAEAEPMVITYVSIDDPSIDADRRVPPELLQSGVEVHAKVRCGDRPMGYSLFYGVYEFLYEKVVFFF
jgi:hypothetical protein